MLKYLSAMLALVLWSSTAFGQAYSLIYQMRNSTDTSTLTRTATPPNAHAFLFSDASSKIPRWGTFGSTCSIALGILDCQGVQSDFTATSGPSAILNLPSAYPSSRALISDATTFGRDWLAQTDVTAAKSTLGVPTNLSDLTNDVGFLTSLPTHTHTLSQLSDSTALGRSLVAITSETNARTLIGAGTSNFDGAYGSLSGIPTSFTPTSHTHVVTALSDSTSIGRDVLTATTQAAARSAIGAGTATVQRIRVQTDTSGAYTWTYPTAYGSGITPVISVTVEDGSTSIWTHQISTPTNTSVTIQLTKTTPVTVSGTLVLGVDTDPQAYVHITAIAP